MVVPAYIDNSSNHTPTNTYFRDSPMTGRSPIKVNVFHRYTGNRKKKWCPIDGRGLVYFKEAQFWSCTECGHTEYIVEQKQQPEQQGVGGVMSVDGLSDTRQTSRGPMKFRSLDARKRFLKKESEIDDELRAMAEAGGWTIKRYDQRIEQSSGEVLSQEELRQNK